ncbi:dihydrolipoyllysine-residue acetyltransferase [Candidatus Pandoraea novymonadis]|uniref:Acetyltransferase component of pyruvate dehydrogenase complex n=1 Tax=Candidatus Pandoraea novymonadis TaxID=1808959 RepID=A0ABX5FE47_9BURK|nr:dihydrolipoyllysine-residue acetyltransferase [Candidatus Pandoraea novymonadis]PSB91946.1 Dihydrolipoyllysine-residue acetyltransferase component of pyruvate dehydrogenase complex [Candidatus Pandoraea novymonadis]
MSQVIEVKIPDIGDFKDLPVVEVLVKVGDIVSVEQSLITLESDKATIEVPSSASGVVKNLMLKVGDNVSEGTLILSLEESCDSIVPAAVSSPSISAQDSFGVSSSNTSTKVPVTSERKESLTISHAGPSVRKFARELGVDVGCIEGSGRKGRITFDDVRTFVKNILSGNNALGAVSGSPTGAGVGDLNLLPWPKVDFAKFGPVELKDISRIKKISGANLHRNWVMVPHVTNNDEADITELEAFRINLNKENEKSGTKVTMLAFVMKACVMALKRHVTFNASFDGDNLVLKKYFHIGFAADTLNGLMVPIVRDVDKKGVFEIARETGELARLARDGKLKPDQMQGGCFSISSLGGIGGTTFTPIINVPEVAILGLSRSSLKPTWDNQKQQFVPRLILPLSLSYDHRVIDGAEAARFNSYLGELLQDFRRVIL